jgi:transposase-like protein
MSNKVNISSLPAEEARRASEAGNDDKANSVVTISPPSPMVSPEINPAPDTEVSARPQRRKFTAEYKMRMLDEVDAAKQPGVVGIILRREGLYSSHLTEWRKERRRGAFAALSKKRGRKTHKNPLADELEQVRRENAKLKQRLAQAELIIDVQKKIASILGIPLKSRDDVGSAS